LAKSLVDKVDYGSLDFNPENTATHPVTVHRGAVEVGDRQHREKATFETLARPVRQVGQDLSWRSDIPRTDARRLISLFNPT
jgi:hypothetical protein